MFDFDFFTFFLTLCALNHTLTTNQNTKLLDQCMLSNNIMDYFIVSQGKTSIPGVDDGEECELTDVRHPSTEFFFIFCEFFFFLIFYPPFETHQKSFFLFVIYLLNHTCIYNPSTEL